MTSLKSQDCTPKKSTGKWAPCQRRLPLVVAAKQEGRKVLKRRHAAKTTTSAHSWRTLLLPPLQKKKVHETVQKNHTSTDHSPTHSILPLSLSRWTAFGMEAVLVGFSDLEQLEQLFAGGSGDPKFPQSSSFLVLRVSLSSFFNSCGRSSSYVSI